MLFELHQDNTFCQSVVKVSTNVSIEWHVVPILNPTYTRNTCSYNVQTKIANSQT